nr:transposase [Kaistia soli]
MIDFTIIRGAPARRRRRGDSEKRYWPFARWAHDQSSYKSECGEGLAVGFSVTPGRASDMTAYGDLMDEDVPDPVAMLADKGYDSDAIRDDLKGRGIEPVIPTKSSRKIQRPRLPADLCQPQPHRVLL